MPAPSKFERPALTPLQLTRRAVVVGGASCGAGAGLGLAAKAYQESRAWTPIRSGQYVTVNGLRYEVECGSNELAVQRSKGGVFRFTMIPRNFWKGDNQWDSERTELDGWPRQLESDKQIWSSWSMFYEEGPPSTSDWCILRQIIHVGGWPMPHLLKPGGNLMWIGGSAEDDLMRHQQTIEQGHWLHFVETYKFDPGGNGFWKSWLNGQQVLDYKGKLGNLGSTHCYVKFGIYRAIRMTWDGILDIEKDPEIIKVREQVSVRYANMRFDYDDLSKLIGNPEPIADWEAWPG